MAHTSGLTHDAVMATDTELQTVINDVPAFYSVPKPALVETYGLSQTQAQNVGFQGKAIHLLLYAQRCKLHLPYSTRTSEDPAYYLSREICIKYARLIIQSGLWQETSDIDTVTRFMYTELLIGVFLACIVLLMDLTVNPLSPQYETQREEVVKSFQIIAEAKNGSETTGKFVDSILHILRKYNEPPPRSLSNQRMQPTAAAGSRDEQSRAIPRNEVVLNNPEVPGYGEYGEMAFPGTSHGQVGIGDGPGIDMVAEAPEGDGEADLSSYWNDLTRSFEQGVDVGNFDWDNIFAELDSACI